MKYLYLSSTELNYGVADIKSAAVADGRNVISIQRMPPEASVMLGDKRMWAGDQMDFWMVEAE